MAVVLGIAGSLIGVVVGAFLTRWIDAGYERRREVRQAVASALTLREELLDAEQGIKVMVEDEKTTTAFLFPGLIGAWEVHREALLAVGMPHQDWVFLAQLFRQLLEVTTKLTSQPEAEMSENDIQYLKDICGECSDGRGRLEPFIAEVTDIPLVRPTRIFDGSSKAPS